MFILPVLPVLKPIDCSDIEQKESDKRRAIEKPKPVIIVITGLGQ